MLFRLLKNVGSHSQGGRTYVAGDVIETDDDLVGKFGKKFEKVHGNVEVSEGELELGPNIPTPASVQGQDDGDKGVSPDSSPEPAPADDTIEEPVKKEDDSEYGEDVTNLFPTAGELVLKVYVKSHWYTIVDTEDGQVLNEKKIRESEVQSFLESYAPNDEDVDEKDEENE